MVHGGVRARLRRKPGLAYRRIAPDLEQQIKTIYEGNVERGWMTPKILRYTDRKA